jgi:hypothetical protein
MPRAQIGEKHRIPTKLKTAATEISGKCGVENSLP